LSILLSDLAIDKVSGFRCQLIASEISGIIKVEKKARTFKLMLSANRLALKT